MKVFGSRFFNKGRACATDRFRTIVYVKADLKQHEFVYTGIEFKEFVEALCGRLKNILLIKANDSGNEYRKNFEIVEGEEGLAKLAKEDVYHYGDFCFVDYALTEDIDRLNKQEIAELLYMGHMVQPFCSPFFDKLNNRYAYLAHDDGFFGKLYCKHIFDFLLLLSNKIENYFFRRNGAKIRCELQNQMLSFLEEGLLFDLEEMDLHDEIIRLPIFIIGRYDDMDDIYNHLDELKKDTVRKYLELPFASV